MICKNCKEMIPDDSTFCPSCGQKAEADSVVERAPTFSPAFRQPGSLNGSDSGNKAPVEERQQAEPQNNSGLRFSSSFKHTDNAPIDTPTVTPAAPRDKMDGNSTAHFEDCLNVNHCPHCGGVLDADARFCNNCGKKLGEPLVKKVMKKLAGIKLPKLKRVPGISKKGVIAAISIALALAIILTVGFATNWFGATGPAVQVAAAVKNTLTAKNFSVDFEYTYNEYREWGAEGVGTAYISFNPDKRELTLFADLIVDGESGTIAVYDGYSIVSSNNRCRGEDISRQLDAFFDTYEESTEKDFSWEDFINSIFYDDAYEDAEEDIDFDKLDTCLAAYVKNLNNKKWLEENAGYTIEKEDGVTQHCMAPDIYSFLKASLKLFEPAFVEASDYDYLYDEVRNMRIGSKETDAEIVFGVKSGKLTEFRLDITGPYEGLTNGNEIHVEADFYDFGKTEFDTDELEDMLVEAKKNGY